MRKGILRRLAQLVVFVLLMAASLFLSAGRWDWVMAWVLVGAYTAGIAINAVILIRKSPDLIVERSGFKEGTKAWDKVLAPFMGLLGPLAVAVVAGLDRRFGWSQTFPFALQLAGLAFALLGYALVSWAMTTNRFFSSTVRIQTERGHTVVCDGPYRHVRHPGYVGMVVFDLAMPMMLGSLWALVPAGLTVGLIVIRTALEDKTLQAELEGYKAYAHRVRYCLLVGIW